MNILGLIPARGGSKGVPHKNIKKLKGRPLLWYTARAALNAQQLSRVVLSTDSKLIAEVGRACGLEVPLLRPSYLAEDITPTLPVIQHALDVLEKDQDKFDAVCLLQPTSPFRDASTIDDCVDLFLKSGAESLITLLKVPERYHPYFMYFRNEDGQTSYCIEESTRVVRRQDVRPAYVREGSVYITKRDVLMEQDSLYGKTTVGYLIDSGKSINIDSMEDWNLAEKLMMDRKDEPQKNTDS